MAVRTDPAGGHGVEPLATVLTRHRLYRKEQGQLGILMPPRRVIGAVLPLPTISVGSWSWTWPSPGCHAR